MFILFVICYTQTDRTCAGSDKCLYIRTYTYTYIYTYVHTYIHTYIHTYTHTYIHTYIHTHTYIRKEAKIDFLPLENIWLRNEEFKKQGGNAITKKEGESGRRRGRTNVREKM